MQLRSPRCPPLVIPCLAATMAIAGCTDATTAPHADATNAVTAVAGVSPAVVLAMRTSVSDVTNRILPTLDGSATELRRAFDDLTDALDAGNTARIGQSHRLAQRTLASMGGAATDPELAAVRVVLDQLEQILSDNRKTNTSEAAR